MQTQLHSNGSATLFIELELWVPRGAGAAGTIEVSAGQLGVQQEQRVVLSPFAQAGPEEGSEARPGQEAAGGDVLVQLQRFLTFEVGAWCNTANAAGCMPAMRALQSCICINKFQLAMHPNLPIPRCPFQAHCSCGGQQATALSRCTTSLPPSARMAAPAALHRQAAPRSALQRHGQQPANPHARPQFPRPCPPAAAAA